MNCCFRSVIMIYRRILDKKLIAVFSIRIAALA